jgi:1-acyl-sn-glycerol-3-phosphate acyltransferase
MASLTLKLLGTTIFALRRWTFEPLPEYWQKKQVLIAFPHSEWLDTTMAFSGFAMVGVKGHIIVKQESFEGPFGSWLRQLGGIPVDRSTSTGVVEQMVAEFADREEFQLALVPEGTRNNAGRLKTGFWHIAKGANVPIVCWYLDKKNKRTRWLGWIEPTDDLERDLAEIRRLYFEAGHEIVGIPLPD